MIPAAIRWARSVPGLVRRERQVLRNLADRASEQNNFECWPHVETIANDLGYTPRTVRRALAGLRAKGLVSVAKTGGGKVAGKPRDQPGRPQGTACRSANARTVCPGNQPESPDNDYRKPGQRRPKARTFCQGEL